MIAIRRMSKRERRLILTQYAFLTPQLILFLGLTIVPFIVAIPMLFTDQSSFTDPQVNQIGLRNFTAIFRDPHYHGQGDTAERLDYTAMARIVTGLDTMLNTLLARGEGP